MVLQAVDVGDLNDRTAGWQLCGPWDRRILVQREVSAPLVIVMEEPSKYAPERPLIPHDDVIKTLPPQGSDQAFHERILPRGAGCDQNLLGAKTVQQLAEVGSITAVAIAHQVSGAAWSRNASRICWRVQAAVG